MPEIPLVQLAPTASMYGQGVDFETAIDWVNLLTTLTAIEANVKDLRGTEGKPYFDMLCKARIYRTSERPEPLQKLLNDDQTMDDILTILQEAADETKHTSADQLTLMTWQARYLLVKFQTTQIRCNLAIYDAGSYLMMDTDFNERIDTLVRWMKGEFVTVLTELDTLLPGMRYAEVYVLNGPDPDITAVGAALNAAELQARQDEVLQADMLDENWGRDHRIRCALCLDTYATDDPAFQLTCGHVVGRTCMSTWLNSTNVQATSCPH